MAAFECNGCGKCCQSYGAFIRIERQVTERDYFCYNGITNEHFQVHVQPAFAGEISDEFEESEGAKHPGGRKGCPFLYRDPDNRFTCTVYPTRPAICREFRCYRMLIRHEKTGEIRGKIVGAGQLSTSDENLLSIWNREIAILPRPAAPTGPEQHSKTPGARIPAHMLSPGQENNRKWLATVAAILASHGYRGDPVE